MSLRDIVNRMPDTKSEISDYVIKNHKDIREAVMANPQYRASLDQAVDTTFEKYAGYLNHWTGKLSGAGHAVGYAADAWFVGTGDIFGSLGGKFWNLLAQLPEKAYGLWYGISTGNYLDSAQNILEGAVSYLPGFTFVDQGLDRIVRKRIVSDVVSTFGKDTGLYKPWTARLSENLAGSYTGVKDRSKNVFRPSYQPGLAAA